MITSYVCPPIPWRGADWCAYLDGDEECGPYGFGATEADAVLDLEEWLAMDFDEVAA